MKITIDPVKCESHGQCEYVAPEVFFLDEDGEVSIREDVPKSLRSKVELAVSVCPTLAISLED